MAQTTDIVLSAGFVLLSVAFFRKQLGLSKIQTLAAAFLLSIIVGLEPVVRETLPAFAPWLDATIQSVVIFLSAAGSVDLTEEVAQKVAEKVVAEQVAAETSG